MTKTTAMFATTTLAALIFTGPLDAANSSTATQLSRLPDIAISSPASPKLVHLYEQNDQCQHGHYHFWSWCLDSSGKKYRCEKLRCKSPEGTDGY